MSQQNYLIMSLLTFSLYMDLKNVHTGQFTQLRYHLPTHVT